jgi:hypothetical protein
MKHITSIIIITFLFVTFSYGQEKRVKPKDVKKLIELRELKKVDIKHFKKPINTFIAAGVSYRIGSNYGVVISPIDNTVQFQKKPNLHSGISTGMVWTPFTSIYKSNDKNNKLQYIKRNKGFSIALLINVFNLSFSGEQVDSTTPINVGFGVGWRDKGNGFLALLTYEFTPLRQPRNYFIDAYKGKNIPLFLSGTQEPVKAININDDSLFYTKLYQFIGVKIAYSFGFKK